MQPFYQKLIITGLMMFFSIINSCSKHEESPETLWEKTYGESNNDIGYSVQETSDGGFVIAGVTYDGSSGIYVWLIKTDSLGYALWARTYGEGSMDYGWSVKQTRDDGYIIAGQTASFGMGSDDVYLIRTNAQGDILWEKTYGGTSSDHGYSVQETADGGYIVAGETYSFGAGNLDVYLIKTDENGDTLWTKTFGGEGFDRGYSVQETRDGGYIITGSIRSFGTEYSDVWLIKTDENGDALWTKAYGGSNYDKGHSVEQTSDGGYIIAGKTYSLGAGNSDVYLIKTDSLGHTKWTKTYGGTGEDIGYAVQETSDGGYIVAGVTSSFGEGLADVYLIKTDIDGDVVWIETYGGEYEEEGRSVQQTSDGGYIIAGSTFSFGSGNHDVYLIKTASDN